MLKKKEPETRKERNGPGNHVTQCAARAWRLICFFACFFFFSEQRFLLLPLHTGPNSRAQEPPLPLQQTECSRAVGRPGGCPKLRYSNATPCTYLQPACDNKTTKIFSQPEALGALQLRPKPRPPSTSTAPLLPARRIQESGSVQQKTSLYSADSWLGVPDAIAGVFRRGAIKQGISPGEGRGVELSGGVVREVVASVGELGNRWSWCMAGCE